MKLRILTVFFAGWAGCNAGAHEIASKVEAGTLPAFDITRAGATTDGRLTTFMMEVAGDRR